LTTIGLHTIVFIPLEPEAVDRCQAANGYVEDIMNTVFSYIVQKRLSQENENVATEALAFILDSSERGRSGLMKLLRGIAPDLPALRFRTQQTEGSARPDMWGLDGDTPRVFIEFKFWAGLTENQPVEYLRLLSGYPSPALLLVVVPAARLETVWRGLKRRLAAANVSNSNLNPSASVAYAVATESGPILVIASWANVLSAIEAELNAVDDMPAKNDLLQVRALCEAADLDAAEPFSSTELTNQRTPAFVLQLNTVVQLAVNLGDHEGVLSIDGGRPQANWERVGRYISFPKARGVGAWFGTDFRRWRERGSTPLWLVFPATGFGRADDVRKILESWTERRDIECSVAADGFGVGIDVPPGEEQDHVVRSIVNRLADVAAELSRLTAKPGMTP
jgi:hypothetical protein